MSNGILLERLLEDIKKGPPADDLFLKFTISTSLCQRGGDTVEIVHHDDLYGRSYGDWPWAYRCKGCGSYVGMHPFTNIPLGTLATTEMREARKRCKSPFEALYKSGRLTRSDAYKRLAEKLGIEHEACHFGWFDVEMCLKAEQAAREIFIEIYRS